MTVAIMLTVTRGILEIFISSLVILASVPTAQHVSNPHVMNCVTGVSMN